MAEPTVYLFDGHNLLYAGDYTDARELADRLAGFLALRGAHGVVVFDGSGEDAELGPLAIRYAPHADSLLERLAAELRGSAELILVSSDGAVRATAGVQVRKLGSAEFARELPPVAHTERRRSELLDRLDPETLARLERLRRGL